jgi:hypothetical protein
MPTEPTSTVGGTSRATKFSLAANFDPELVPALAPYPVDEVYGRIAAQAVSLSPQYRTEALGKYAEMEDTMIAGGLWGV